LLFAFLTAHAAHFAPWSWFHYDLEHRPFRLVYRERTHFVCLKVIIDAALNVILLLTYIAVAEDIEV
jgi:hypothetical protein|tara:strand:- start:1491 stop:1691 length:201 start_codon:yes stop_codon:yes gene_type:complete